MTDDDDPQRKRVNALVHTAIGTHLDVARRGNRLMARIAEDALNTLPLLADKRWKVGDYEVDELTYNFIVTLIRHLTPPNYAPDVDGFSKWQDLRLQQNDINQSPPWIFCAKVMKLCVNDGEYLTHLDLAGAPNLTGLWCDWNDLTELDLTYVPKLTELNCDSNHLTELDLTSVPNLTKLSCASNALTALDLTAVPNLTALDCNLNKLTKLDLTSAPNLTQLKCADNQLTELDIRNCLKLRVITCDHGVLVHKRPEQVVRHPA